MARSDNQKLKLLYLSKIMKEKTDDTHYLTMPQIIAELNSYGIEASRKSIYTDIEALNTFGIDILKERIGSQTYYHCGNREFEIAELKFLVDAIQSSKFITVRKTKDLIKKLESLVSTYDAKLLEREVYVAGRIKNMDETIYYSIDAIHTAISEGHKLQFKYFSWNVKGEEEFRRDGAFYNVSPWALHFDDERYYLIGYDHDKEEIRHFRVDKMREVELTDKRRKGKRAFNKQDKAKWSEQYFRMFGGEIETVTLKCKNEMANVIIDQFGKDAWLHPIDDEWFTASVNVAVSDQFLGWIVALGGKVVITGPESAKERMKGLVEKRFVE